MDRPPPRRRDASARPRRARRGAACALPRAEPSPCADCGRWRAPAKGATAGARAARVLRLSSSPLWAPDRLRRGQPPLAAGPDAVLEGGSTLEPLATKDYVDQGPGS